MLKEFWINVYENHALGGNYNLDIAKFKSRTEDMKTIYRIHVKMWNKLSRSYYPYIWKDGKSVVKPIKKPVRRDINYIEKGDWMG